VLRKRLEDRPDRGDADPGAHEQHPVAMAPGCGESAVGAFDRDPGPGPKTGTRAAVVAEGPDGDPQERRRRERGERVGVRLPPQVPVEEAPLEVLAALAESAPMPTSRTKATVAMSMSG
jgi:hypothetical protein